MRHVHRHARSARRFAGWGSSVAALGAALLVVGLTSPASSADAAPEEPPAVEQGTAAADGPVADQADATSTQDQPAAEEQQVNGDQPATAAGEGDAAEAVDSTDSGPAQPADTGAEQPASADAEVDEHVLSALTVEVTDEAGVAVSGVGFELWLESNDVTGLQPSGDTETDFDCTTAGDGTCTAGVDAAGAAQLVPGTYYWVQTATPEGYQAPEDGDEPVGAVTITEDEAGTDLDPTEVTLVAVEDEPDELATDEEASTEADAAVGDDAADEESASNDERTSADTQSTGDASESAPSEANDRPVAASGTQPLATTASGSWSLSLSSTPRDGSTVTLGDTIRYTLTARNTQSNAVTGAAASIDLTDALQSADLVTPLPSGVSQRGDVIIWEPTRIPGCSTFLFWCITDGQTSVSVELTVKTALADDATFSSTAVAGDKGNCSGGCTVTHTVDVPEPASPSCAAGYVYGLSGDGQMRQVANGSVSNFGEPASNVSSFNGLGIGANGGSAFAYERTNSAQAVTIYRFDTSNGTWSSTGQTLNSTSGGRTVAFVAGAVNLGTGQYMFGGFNPSGTSFGLWSFAPTSQAITYLGHLDTSSGSGGTANGDMAFDADGNLFVVRGSGSTTTVFSVTAANLAAASGGQITSARSASVQTMGDVNGVAFDASGRAYLGSANILRSYSMPSWDGSQTVVSSGLSSTDLATCSSPATITIEKFVEGDRVTPTDQFTLTLQRGSQVLGTATTTGSAAGLQDERVGPLPAARGVQLSFSETFTNGNADDYAASYQCTADGAQDPIVSGAGSSGTITIPAGAQAVVCQIHNAPLVANVTVHKDMTDAEGNTPEPYQGWTVGTQISAATNAATLTPSATTQATDSSGDATWTVNFDRLADRATLTVLEEVADGFGFVGGRCTVTSLDGSSVVTDLSSESGELTDVAPGDDVSCIFVNRPSVPDIEVLKQGWDAQDNEIVSGSSVVSGTVITWTYEVTNTGETTLHDIAVVDDQVGTADCPATSLPPGESMTCTASGPVTALP